LTAASSPKPIITCLVIPHRDHHAWRIYRRTFLADKNHS